jgi:hypothetical protein
MNREADATAFRFTPLTIVSGAVAGDDLERMAGAASAALGRPVAIVVPGAGAPVVSPRGALAPFEARAVVDAALNTLMGSAPERDAAALLQELRRGAPADVGALVTAARRLGLDLARGAVALCAAGSPDTPLPVGVLGWIDEGRVVGLAAEQAADDLAREIRALGMRVALSAPRRDPALLHDAVQEAELLLELPGAGQEDTYRLLIGVLLRDPDELELLVRQTIAPIADYDDGHDTELLATLETFLAHDGSTTDTAEAMNLHRHTVGYRLARAHEVSGLSPYESSGRERLSLGLKAQQILAACRRRLTRL